jgi:hypothetical protein
VTFLPVLGQIVGIVTGLMGLNQIKQTGERGRGLALAGLWIGIGSFILVVIGIILAIVIAIAVGSSVHTGDTYSYPS